MAAGVVSITERGGKSKSDERGPAASQNPGPWGALVHSLRGLPWTVICIAPRVLKTDGNVAGCKGV